MTKKIFAISTLLFVLVIGAIFIYNFIFKKPNAAPKAATTSEKTAEEGKTGTATPESNSSESSSASAAITAVSESQAYGATLSPDKSSIYYFSGDNGQLNQVDFSGKLVKVISTEEFANIKKVLWNKPGNKAVLKTAPGSNQTKFLLLDLEAKKVSVLSSNIDSIAWSNQGDKIIYKYFDPKTGKRTISISDPAGGNWRDLADFDYLDVSIAPVPSSSNITFWPGANAFQPTSVNSIGFNGTGKKEILKDRYGTDVLWAPDGSLGIASCTDEKGGHKTNLFSMNASGGEFQTLQVPTFASKCAWSQDSKNIYCALPGNIPETAILPNDWQEGKVSAADTFWKINTATAKKERLVDPEKISGSFDAINLFLSGDEKTLFFTSKSDGKLYKLSL